MGAGGFIEVSGANTADVAGTYFISDEKAASAPKNAVWKLDGNDRFIFNPGTENGWRIGDKDDLATNNYWYKSKSIFDREVRLKVLKVCMCS